MSTIINGRGIISKIEEEERPPLETEPFKCMTIEEYRNLKLTPEQEWNNMYNAKKVSIEALKNIEIRKRGKGPEKKVYSSAKSLENGPYYDPGCNHVHVWKKRSLIKNFIGT